MPRPRKQPVATGAPSIPFQIANDTVGFLLWDTSRRFVKVFSDFLAQHGLNFGLWPAMRTLLEEDGLTQKELSERLGLRGPTLVEVIAELDRRGFITRRQDPNDRRRANISLTEAGRTAVTDMMPKVALQNAAGLEGLSDAEVDQLKDMLRRMRDNMEKF